MANFSMQIPQARDTETNQIIKSDRAELNAIKGRYKCLDPKCNSDLIVASSKYGRVHFRHHSGAVKSGCRYSGIKQSQKLHIRAQNYLAIVLEEALARRCPMPTMLFETPTGVKTVLPFIGGSTVVKEWSCKEIGRRPDIAILDSNDIPILLIEIKHTHAVDFDKRQALSKHWWIEVEAKEIITNPLELFIRAHGNFPYQYELLGNQGILF